jgi:hypothetical protein
MQRILLKIESLSLLKKFALLFGVLIFLCSSILLAKAVLTFTEKPEPTQSVSTSKPEAEEVYMVKNPETSSAIIEGAVQSAQQTTSNPPPPGCKDRAIPRGTDYKDASWIDQGKTETLPGFDGKERVCTIAGKTPTITTLFKPYNDTVYRGTYVAPTYNAPTYTPPPPPTPSAPAYTPAEAQRLAEQKCSVIARAGGTNQSAYPVCINTVLRQLGY